MLTLESYSKFFPNNSDASSAIVRLDFDAPSRIWTLQFLENDTPDNRLTHRFILDGMLPALGFVETQWNEMVNHGASDQGAALITTGQTHDRAKIYSNGLDLEKAISDPHFFDQCLNPLYQTLLTFPIPTIAAVGGHAFAGGFGLIAAHDYRVMNSKRGYLCMNEIDFGAQLPHGLQQTLATKIVQPQLMRKVVLEGHRFSATEAFKHGIVDVITSDKDEFQGPKGTLIHARQLAEKVKTKASKDVWGSNKLVLYAPQLAILRTKHSVAMENLYLSPSSPSSKL